MPRGKAPILWMKLVNGASLLDTDSYFILRRWRTFKFRIKRWKRWRRLLLSRKPIESTGTRCQATALTSGCTDAGSSAEQWHHGRRRPHEHHGLRYGVRCWFRGRPPGCQISHGWLRWWPPRASCPAATASRAASCLPTAANGEPMHALQPKSVKLPAAEPRRGRHLPELHGHAQPVRDRLEDDQQLPVRNGAVTAP